MDTGQTTYTTQMDALTALTAATAPLATPTLMLIAAPFTFTPEMGVASLTEATFDGYAPAVALKPGKSYIDPVSGASIVGFASETFVATDPVATTNTIYGWALVDAAKAILYAVGSLPTPVPITAGNDGVTIEPAVIWGQ